MNNSKLILLIWLSVLVLSPALIFQPKFSDELAHAEEIIRLINNDYTLVSTLTVLPGYHFIIASTAELLHIDRMPWLRLLSLVICSVFSLFVFNKLVNNDNDKLLTFFYFPIIFPFYFLLYTDIFSMCMVLFAFYFMTRKQYWVSSFFAFLSITVRQNNIIWLGFIMAYLWIDKYKFEINLDNIKKYIGIIKGYILVIMLFFIFIIYNKGIVMGDRTSHPISFHLGNFWAFLFIYFFLFLPENLFKIKQLLLFIKNNKSCLVLIPGMFSLGYITLSNTHPYNQYSVFIHNKIMMFATSNFVNEFIFLSIAIYAFMIILMDADKQGPQEHLIYIFGFIYIGLSWMVEFRYYFIIFAFIILFKQKNNKLINWYTIIYYILINIIMILGMSVWKIFW